MLISTILWVRISMRPTGDFIENVMYFSSCLKKNNSCLNLIWFKIVVAAAEKA